MHRTGRYLLLLAVALTLVAQAAYPVQAAENVVRAVLFYSPSCGHCHYVITEVLPPLMEQYGAQFEIIGVNAADSRGQQLYQATIEHWAVPEERRGVPALVIGDHVLVGSVEIPEQLPGLIASYLEQGGVDWPAIPGLAEAMAAPSTTATPRVAATRTSQPAASASPVAASPSPSPSPAVATATPSAPVIVGVGDASPGASDWRANFRQDPAGNTLSVIVLLGMVASLVYRGARLRCAACSPAATRWRRVVPALVALGLVIAGYLAYVETQQVTAVCGPVGDCNTVQQSEFALLFGFLPVAVLGLLGYTGIGVAWAVARYGRGLWADLALVGLQAMAWFGLLFSIYLTFLEPFVIGATCAWCLMSAVVMTILFWVVAPAPRHAMTAQ